MKLLSVTVLLVLLGISLAFPMQEAQAEARVKRSASSEMQEAKRSLSSEMQEARVKRSISSEMQEARVKRSGSSETNTSTSTSSLLQLLLPLILAQAQTNPTLAATLLQILSTTG